jgi:hypothetical protein
VIKGRAIEALGLLMILDYDVFDKYVEMFVKSIDEERPEQRKSPQVIKMLKTIYDGLIVHSYMLKALS